MYEIRIHSRGGQGGVTAARLLAMAALHDGKYATACPFYGAERRGAPVVSFVRIDDFPIKVYSQIREPDVVVVLDTSVMETVDVLHGIKKGGSVLINSTHRQEFPGFVTYNIDLTGIALGINLVVAGSPILNTPVLGDWRKPVLSRLIRQNLRSGKCLIGKAQHWGYPKKLSSWVPSIGHFRLSS